MRTRTMVAVPVAVLLLAAALVAGQAAPERFDFDDFSRVQRVSDPQFSPDGASIAVIVATPNLEENRHFPARTATSSSSGPGGSSSSSPRTRSAKS